MPLRKFNITMFDINDTSDPSNDKDTELLTESIGPEVLPALDSDVEFTAQDKDDDSTALESAFEQALVVPNALQRYLSEIRKYPLLAREEEREIAYKAYDDQDLNAKKQLVTANLRLVVKIAMDYKRAYTQLLDLIQEGNAGLVQAVQRFNPYRDVKLSTYSAWWIRAYILKFLMDNKSLVRMGTTDAQRRLFFKLRSEAQQLYARTQKFDTKMLADKIGVTQQDVIEMDQRLSKSDLSLDTPISSANDGDTNIRQMDILPDENDNPEISYEKKELLKILRTKIAEFAKTLKERDLYILTHRILADEPVTLQEIGDKYGITRERARQLEGFIMKKIKSNLQPMLQKQLSSKM